MYSNYVQVEATASEEGIICADTFLLTLGAPPAKMGKLKKLLNDVSST